MTRLIGGIGSRTKIAQPPVDMDLAMSSIQALIDIYKEEFGVDPTTIIYGAEQRDVAIEILHGIPKFPMQAWIAARISQVYCIPHLGLRWGVIGVEGMVMTEGV